MTEEQQAYAGDEKAAGDPNTEHNAGTPAGEAVPAGSPAKGGRGLAVLALLLAIAAAGGAGYAAWQLHTAETRDQQRLAQRIDQALAPLASRLESAEQRLAALDERTGGLPESVSELDERVEELEQEVTAAGKDLGDLERELTQVADDASDARTDAREHGKRLQQAESRLRGIEQRQSALEDRQAELAQRTVGTERYRAATDATYLLRLANERMLLFGDTASALEALRLAQQRLRRVDDPVLRSVRQSLARDIERLEAVPTVDRSELSGRLDALIDAVTDWPLARTVAAEREPPEAERAAPPESIWAEARRVLGELFVVRRVGDRAERTPLGPRQAWFLRQNLNAQLANAQAALVRDQAGPYRDALRRARRWIRAYFDTEAPAVASGLEALTSLAEAPLDPDLPEVGDALRRLENLRAGGALAPTPPEAGE